jgi:hypothetical protein
MNIFLLQQIIDAANNLIENEPQNELWTEIMEVCHQELEQHIGPMVDPDSRVGAPTSPTLIKVWVMTEFFHQIIDMTGQTTRPAGDNKTYALHPKDLIGTNDSYRQVITAKWVSVDSEEFLSAQTFRSQN